MFELATGEFLFEPRKGSSYGKNDDHIAQMMELLGRMPRDMALSGIRSRRFFKSSGQLRRINGLHYWPLKKVLTDKYKFNDLEAQGFADFLLPMLHWDPHKRATAQKMLEHPWLKMQAKYDVKQEKPSEQSTFEYESHTYYKEEMGKLTDGSENDCADAECDLTDPFEDDDFWSSGDERPRDTKLKRNLTEGKNLNNSFGHYDPADWEHLHNDKGINTQFEQLKHPPRSARRAK